MPKFNADTIGGELEYDFSPWLSKEFSDRRGVVPEPSRAAVNDLMRKIQSNFKELGLANEDDDDSTTPAEIADRVSKIADDEMFEKIAEAINAAVGELCAGTPSVDTIEALPYRPFMGFFGFIVGNLMNPEASKPGTNNSPRRLTSV